MPFIASFQFQQAEYTTLHSKGSYLAVFISFSDKFAIAAGKGAANIWMESGVLGRAKTTLYETDLSIRKLASNLLQSAICSALHVGDVVAACKAAYSVTFPEESWEHETFTQQSTVYLEAGQEYQWEFLVGSANASASIGLGGMAMNTTFYALDVNLTSVSIVNTSSNVTASAGAHGSIDPSGNTPVEDGDSITFHATADPGYRPYQWIVNGNSVPEREGYADFLLANVSGPTTVQVTFTAASVNDSNNSYTQATNFGVVEGEKNWQSLEITSGDVDYYKFTLTSRGTASDFVSIYGMSSGTGSNDLDIALGRVNNVGTFRPATGKWYNVASSYEDQDSSNRADTLSLEGFGPGEYYAIVYGSTGLDDDEIVTTNNVNFAGTETGSYKLLIRAPMADVYEPDSAADIASVIRTDGTAQHHSLPHSDVDWVKFTLEQPSNVVIRTDELIGSDGEMTDIGIQLFGPNLSTRSIAFDSDGEGDAEIRARGPPFSTPARIMCKSTRRWPTTLWITPSK